MRSKGLLVWNTFSQLFSAYAVFVDAIALNAIGYKYYPVYHGSRGRAVAARLQMCVAAVLHFRSETDILCSVMVETKGYTLEEIAQAFDGSTAQLVPAQAYLRSDEEAQAASVTDDKKRDL